LQPILARWCCCCLYSRHRFQSRLQMGGWIANLLCHALEYSTRMGRLICLLLTWEEATYKACRFDGLTKPSPWCWIYKRMQRKWLVDLDKLGYSHRHLAGKLALKYDVTKRGQTIDLRKLQIDFSDDASNVKSLHIYRTISEKPLGCWQSLHRTQPWFSVEFKWGQIGFSPWGSFPHWICANSTILSPSTTISTGCGSGSASGSARARADEMSIKVAKVWLVLNNMMAKIQKVR